MLIFVIMGLQFADKITLERIGKMNVMLRSQLEKDYIEINKRLPKGVRLRFSQGFRTIQEQNELYAQGRTTKGRIVTNAKGGDSYHNYGLAFDIVLLYDDKGNGSFSRASWDLDKNFMRVVEYFKSKGWEWGGDFRSFKDYPHFQKTYGQSISQLKKNNLNK